MEVFVNFENEVKSFDVEPTDKVSQLKMKISEYYGLKEDSAVSRTEENKTEETKELVEKALINMKNTFSIEKIRLSYQNIDLENDKSLSDYKIGNHSQLDCHEKLYGGLIDFPAFIDWTDKNLKKIKLTFSQSAPQYRLVKRGLNIFGKCENDDCEVFKNNDEAVYCGDGIINTKFDFTSNIENIVCPICGCLLSPTTCGFYDCEYQFIGDKREKGKINHFESTPAETGSDEFEYLVSSAAQAKWKSLIIYVMERQTVKYQNNK